MAVYIDALLMWPKTKSWRLGKACHCFADSEEELHAFAKKLGMKRSWFQDHPRLPHYDLTEKRRAVAVKLGAIEVDRRFVCKFMGPRK